MNKIFAFIALFFCFAILALSVFLTIYSVKANQLYRVLQDITAEITETPTSELTLSPLYTYTIEQSATSTITVTETYSNISPTPSLSSTPEPTSTPTPLVTQTLQPTLQAINTPQNPPSVHRTYYTPSRPPIESLYKAKLLSAPSLKAAASVWGSLDMDSNGKLNQPRDADVDANGNVYVADTQNRRIKVYSPSGSLLRQWGEWGSEEGQFYHPISIAVDKISGFVYVADDWSNQISKFDLDGNLLTRWRITTDWLVALAVSPTNNNPLYVAHNYGGEGTISILNRDNGNAISNITPTYYSEPLRNITDIALNVSGDIYIADEATKRIYRFNQHFNLINFIGYPDNYCTGTANTFCGKISLAVDGNFLYASDHTHRTQKFDLSLNYNTAFGTPGNGNGQLNFPHGIAAANGIVYIADTYNHRIQKFNANGSFQTKWGSDVTANGMFNLPLGIIANNNSIFTADTYNHRVQKFSNAGAFQTKWGSQGYGWYTNDPFKYTRVPDVAYDSSGNIYTIDQWNNRIIKTNPNGTLLRVYGKENGDTYGDAPLQFREPWSIALDKDNNIYIAEIGNHRIQVINQNNQWVRFINFDWGCTNEGLGYNFTITIDQPRDLLYIFDTDQNRVIQYQITNAPTPSHVWGNSQCNWGPGPYEFNSPIGGAIDRNGRLYVADRWNHSIKAYDYNSHTFLGKWGEWGSGIGQFFELTDIAVDNNLYVYALDNGNGYRVQRFEPFFTEVSPPKPTLLAPSGTITNSYFPNYRWKTAAGAFRYEIRIDGGEGKVISPYPYCNADTCEIWLNTPLSVGAHTWQVRASNHLGHWSEWSTPMSFTISPIFPSNFLGNWGWSDAKSGKRMMAIRDIMIDGDDYLYAVDAWSARIYKFTLNGNLMTTIGNCCGTENGRLMYPSGLAVDSNHDIYVADRGIGAIIKFNFDGVYIGTYGKWGQGDDQMKAPADIAIDQYGNFYIIDAEKYRIQKYNSNWNLLWSKGSFGSGDGEFKSPTSITIFGSNLYVTDLENQNVQVFSTEDGKFSFKFGSYGSEDGQFNGPWGITADNNGNLWVADSYGNRIQKFDEEGIFLDTFGSFGFGEGQLSIPSSIAVDNSGNIYVNDAFYSRIQKFNSSYSFQKQWGTPPNAHLNGFLRVPISAGINPKTNQIAVADTYNHQIQFFDLNGNFKAKLGAPGTGNAQFNSPFWVAYDNNGNLYVVDSSNHRIQKFDSNGNYLTQWGSYGSSNGQFKYPTQLFIDTAGNIFIADTENHRIQKFSNDGTHLMSFGSYGSELGQFKYPRGVAVNSNGDIYVSDEGNDRIQRCFSSGICTQEWGGKGNGIGQFADPWGLYIDSHDAVWVADRWNRRIQVFAPNGDYLTQLSSTKKWFEIGYIDALTSISLDPQENILVTIPHTSRVQKFTPLKYTTPDTPTLLEPDLTQYNKPIYRWKPISDAQGYLLEVYKNQTTKPVSVYVDSSNCNSNICSFQPNVILTKGSYQFRLKAQKYNELWSSFSPWKVFTVEPSSPPAAPRLLSPTGNINTNQPVYTWQQVNGAASYYLIVYSYNSGNVVFTQSAINNCSNGTCSFTQPSALQPGLYGYKVRAANSVAVWGNYSPWMNFRVQEQILPVELVSPTNNATNVSLTPTFTWKAVSGASRYYLLVKDVNRGVYPIRRYINCTSSSTCSVKITIPLRGNTTYEYKIRAYNSNSKRWGPYSEVVRFTTQ